MNDFDLNTYMRRTAVSVDDVSQRLSLEKHDLENKVQQVRKEFMKLGKRKLILQDEWKKLKIERGRLDEDKKRFNNARLSPWFQNTLLPTSDMRRIKLNIGGQLFETTVKILRKDPDSLLAALTSDDVPVDLDSSGYVYIDRDWWLFRHVLMFLRCGKLPQQRELLTQLYNEAAFYELEILRQAIREYLDPGHLVERTASMPLSELRTLEGTLKGDNKTTLNSKTRYKNNLAAEVDRVLNKQQDDDSVISNSSDESVEFSSGRKSRSTSRKSNSTSYYYGNDYVKRTTAPTRQRRGSFDWWTANQYKGKMY